jgi:adenylate cyclase
MAVNDHKATTFWEEIKRRKVVRVVVAYLVVGWGLIQIADATLEPLRLPEWSETLVVWLVALGFPIAIVLAWVLDVTPRGIEVTRDVDDEGSEPAAADASIAVLPFVNMSGDPENEYFSDGLSEELLNVLVRLQSVRVCSRTTSFALKGKDFDMPSISRQLGVQHVLEGSVRRYGNRVRITAQLIDAAADQHLWSETYDRELRDIFAVQEEIASHIFESLQLTLTPAQQQAATSTTDDVEALDCYLRGRALYHRTEPGHLEQAREMFEQAIRIDPEYAVAWAGLTYTYVDEFWYRHGAADLLDKARESSLKAVEFAPHLAESHGALGLALRAAERFEEAEAEFKKAMEINPRLFEPIHFYAQMKRSLKDYERSAELFEQAALVRPEDYQAMSLAANMHQAVDNIPEATRTSVEAVARAERATELNPSDARAWILGAGCQLQLNNVDKAFEWLENARQAAPDSNGVAYNSACIYARMGEIERALDLLERAIELGSRNRRYYETDPDLASLQDHPRFQALLEKTI